MIDITDDDFGATLRDAKLPVLLFFTATYCAPSAFFEPMIEQAVKDFDGQVIIATIDIEAFPKLAREMQVKALPSSVIVKAGVPLGSRLGTMTYRQFTGFMRETIGKA